MFLNMVPPLPEEGRELPMFPVHLEQVVIPRDSPFRPILYQAFLAPVANVNSSRMNANFLTELPLRKQVRVSSPWEQKQGSG